MEEAAPGLVGNTLGDGEGASEAAGSKTKCSSLHFLLLLLLLFYYIEFYVFHS